jgi:6-phosphogluconolactonase
MTKVQIAICAGAGKDSAGVKRNGAIHLYAADLAAGTFDEVAVSEAVDHPSYLARSQRRSALYVAGELPVGDGAVTAVHLAENKLLALGHRPTGGNGAVHLCLDRTESFLFAANYQAGDDSGPVSVAVFSLGADATPGAMTDSARHTGHGADPERQSRPHCHCVVISPDNRTLAAVDLGTDSVYFYSFDAAKGAITLATQLKLPPGSGPRHAAFHPSKPLLYVTGELNSKLMTLWIDIVSMEARLADSVDTTGMDVKARNYPSGIAISPDGHYLLAANRGADTIAVFWIDPESGVARLRHEVACGGKFPRAIRFDATARYLAVANQRSGGVSIFGWDFSTSRLTDKPIVKIDIPRPLDAEFIDG